MRGWLTLNTSCCFAAEFIISLAEKHPTFEEFKAVLSENGADFTVSLQLNKHIFFVAAAAAAALCFLTKPIYFFRIPSLVICLDSFRGCEPYRQQVQVQGPLIYFNTSGLQDYCQIICSLLCMTAHQPEAKTKSEKDKMKKKYPALCKPDASVWMVRLI